MNKKLLRTSVIASVMAMAFTASTWAGSPQDNYRNLDPSNIGKITLEYQDVNSLTDAQKQAVGITAQTGIVTPYLDHSVTATGAEHGQNHPWSYKCGEQIYDTDLTIGDLNKALYALSYNDKLLQDQISGASTNDKTIAAGEVALSQGGTITLQHVDENGNINQTTVLKGIASKSALEQEVRDRQNADATEASARASADTNLQNQINTNVTNIASNLTKITQNTNRISVNEQNITNNKNKIEAIEKDYVKSVNVNGDDITFVSNVNGQQSSTTYKDKHVTGLVQSDVSTDGKFTTTITTNYGQSYSDTVDISGYVGKQIQDNAADATYNYGNQYGDNTIGGAIQENTTNITNINNNNVSKVTVEGDNITFTQKINGTDESFTYTDKHITGHNMALNGDSIESTITTNFGDAYSNSVRVGSATIRYEGDTGTQNVSTIEQAINKNYTKIENVENNYVTNISKRQDGTEVINNKTYNVEYYQVTQNVTDANGNTTVETVNIKDTTLVEKNLFGKDANGNKVRAIDIIVPRVLVQDADGNYDASQVAAYQSYVEANGLIGYIDQATGVPEIVMEFEDTSGNVVQGAVDFGTLFAESLQTEAGANIVVTQKARGLGNHIIALADHVTNQTSITFENGIVIGNTTGNNGNVNGLDMSNLKITGVADGEISANSTEAINGSQLWETNRNMDKLGGRLDKVGAGAAALAALHPMDFDPDDKLQFSAGVGNYKGETAAALGAFYRPTEKVMFSVAGTMGNGENMVNAGVTFALDRKNNVSNSRVAMAHEIKDLRDQVAALTALVSQIAGKGNPLLDTVMFPDVPENHWAYDYVEGLQKRGIIEGYPDGNFGGDRSMTRYEYAAMLYRALEKGFPVDGRLLKEFEAELGRIRIDRIKGADDDANKVERVRVNDYEDRDDYGSKLAQVVADAAPAIEEEPAA